MRTFALFIIAVAVSGIVPARHVLAAQPAHEDCGWLILVGTELRQQGDPALKPADPKPLAPPPEQAKAAYCDRAELKIYPGDKRFIELGLPLVFRSGGREGVLEYPPKITF